MEVDGRCGNQRQFVWVVHGVQVHPATQAEAAYGLKIPVREANVITLNVSPRDDMKPPNSPELSPFFVEHGRSGLQTRNALAQRGDIGVLGALRCDAEFQRVG